MQFYRNKAATIYCAVGKEKTTIIRVDDDIISYNVLPPSYKPLPAICELVIDANEFKEFAKYYLQQHLLTYYYLQELLKAPLYDYSGAQW